MGLFDKIKDVIGDIAPVVLPVAINAFLPGLGTVASGALGAGIGTLLQGGDAKDALKSAALGGGIGALKVGMTGSQGSFGKNISADIKQTGTFLSDPLNPSFRSTLAGGTQKPFDYQETVQKVSQASAPVDEQGYLLEPAGPRIDVDTKLTNPDLRNSGLTSLGEPERGFFKGPFQKTFTDPELINTEEFKQLVDKGLSPDKALASLQKSYNPTFMDKFGLPAAGILGLTLLSGSDEEEDDGLDSLEEVSSEQFRLKEESLNPLRFKPTMDDIKVPYVRPFEDGGAAVPNKYKGFSKLPEGVQQKISPELAKKYQNGGVVQSLFALSDSAKNMAGNLQKQIGNMGSSGSGIAGFPSMGMPMTPTQDMPLTRPRPLAGGSSPMFLTADVGSPSSYPDGIVPDQFKNLGMNQQNALSQMQGLGGVANVFGYKDGGEVDFFPRRTGGIGPGEGSGTKDDVPAMLMDGEFVMTRDAVKAAGGGSINKGIDNMYGLMRNLEARA